MVFFEPSPTDAQKSIHTPHLCHQEESDNRQKLYEVCHNGKGMRFVFFTVYVATGGQVTPHRPSKSFHLAPTTWGSRVSVKTMKQVSVLKSLWCQKSGLFLFSRRFQENPRIVVVAPEPPRYCAILTRIVALRSVRFFFFGGGWCRLKENTRTQVYWESYAGHD